MFDIHKIYNIFFRFFRGHRIKLFYDNFQIDYSTKVIDIGGSLYFWELANQLRFVIPKVTIVNIMPNDHQLPYGIEWIEGDGKKLQFEDSTFDIAFCNSVIEHLETYEDQAKFASELRRISKGYFVQTPNRYFPLEPHYISPFIHWFPTRLRKTLVRNFTIRGLLTRLTKIEVDKMVNELRLLTTKEMQILFPDSNLRFENFLFMKKSIIAIK